MYSTENIVNIKKKKRRGDSVLATELRPPAPSTHVSLHLFPLARDVPEEASEPRVWSSSEAVTGRKLGTQVF